MQQSRAYQQRHHEEALKDPMYRLEGMMSVMFEEILMNMPVSQEYHPPVVIPLKTEVIHYYYKEPIKKKRYSKYV